MDLDWTPEARERIDTARQFAERVLAPRRGAAGFDREAWDACGREGILGLPLPESWGGQAQDALTTAGAFEALGRGGADRGLLFAIGAHLFGCALTIARYGAAEQRARWGQGLAVGRVVAALAVTEPGGGSHLSRMATVAEPAGDGYVVCGAKALVTNGPVADLFLVIASEAPARGVMGLTAFLVPREAPGLRVEPLPATLGLHGAPMARIALEGCRVPRDAVLGRPGSGFAVLASSLQHERTLILAGFVGAAERDLAACVAHARGRRGARDPLLQYQAVSHRLARMRCRIESARWQLYRAGWALTLARDPVLAPAMAKLTVSEALVECALDVLRTFAGAAWLDEQGTGTALRDVVGTLSASGTSDVLLDVVAASLTRRETAQ